MPGQGTYNDLAALLIEEEVNAEEFGSIAHLQVLVQLAFYRRVASSSGICNRILLRCKGNGEVADTSYVKGALILG